jgi:Lipase (class 3)
MNFYTFGSPRVGNEIFSSFVMTEFADHAYKRVVHFNDIVPHLPLTAMDFNHAGDEIWYNDESEALSYVVC